MGSCSVAALQDAPSPQTLVTCSPRMAPVGLRFLTSSRHQVDRAVYRKDTGMGNQEVGWDKTYKTSSNLAGNSNSFGSFYDKASSGFGSSSSCGSESSGYSSWSSSTNSFGK